MIFQKFWNYKQLLCFQFITNYFTWEGSISYLLCISIPHCCISKVDQNGLMDWATCPCLLSKPLSKPLFQGINILDIFKVKNANSVKRGTGVKSQLLNREDQGSKKSLWGLRSEFTVWTSICTSLISRYVPHLFETIYGETSLQRTSRDLEKRSMLQWWYVVFKLNHFNTFEHIYIRYIVGEITTGKGKTLVRYHDWYV